MPPLLWAEFSIQYLVPAIFLVIWVLNQVFGKAEAPQAPVRDRVGPRPVPPGGPSRAPQTPSRAPRGNAPERSRTSPSRTQSAKDANRSAKDANRSASRSRSQAKAEEVDPPATRAGESHRVPRPIPADIQEVYAIYDDPRMDEAEIQRGLGPISAEATHGSKSRGAVLPAGLSAWANLGGEQGVDLARLREAIILSEIITPPPTVKWLKQVRATAVRPKPETGLILPPES